MTPALTYQDHRLFFENIALTDIAEKYATPCYIYSRKHIEQQWQTFSHALQDYPHLICYAVKANSNLAILHLLAQLGAGFDIVSEGELERVLAAGGSPDKIIFSGVGKTKNEIQRALKVGIYCFNIESESELQRINDIAQQQNCQAPVSLRVNPDVDAKTHPYISTGLKENKFGIPIDTAEALYLRAKDMPGIQLLGIDCHIGSQLLDITPFTDALKRINTLLQHLQDQGIHLHHIDMGGGLGIPYHSMDQAVSIDQYMQQLLHTLENNRYTLIFEPGRFIVGNAGILLTKVEYLKPTDEKNFAIIDAAMNDLLRPALYQSFQDIIPVQQHLDIATQEYDLVGPICETGDFLGKQRQLALKEGDLLAICSAGAYGFSMSSNYNSRPRVAEILIDGDSTYVIRQRETIQELYANEKIPHTL